MPAENGNSPALKINFLLFCLYVMFYLTLRGNGEIIHQEVDLRTGGGIARIHIVGAGQEIPRWRRQAYRIFFSPLMVAEEEGRHFLAEGRELMGMPE
ncbi:MAG: hypothetical protein LBU64_10325 [Planctomycetota bacterium]|jgi:hypothetical protein|nr:hypothetical protein [Planctomycetota bacterium]